VTTAAKALVSVCIVARNEADRLEACLATVGWADQVVLLDLESTDETAAVARRAGAEVFSHEPFPVVEPLRNVIAAHARHDWVLALDPDERVSDDLAARLAEVAAGGAFDVVEIPVMNFDLGYPASHPALRHDHKPRMYRRTKVAWPEVPNALPSLEELRVLRLAARDELSLIHDRNRTIAEAVERIIRYAPAQAQSMIDAGQVFTAADMLKTLGSKAYWQFVHAEALRDGMPGLLRAVILVNFHFYVWAAFWHQSGVGRTEADERLLRRIDRVLRLARRLVSIWLRVRRLTRRLATVR
jgi:glycosyltransferase involved in cell wall biosynthesis